MLSETIFDKLNILTAAARYDVACTSSGVERKGNGTGIGNATSAGICHCFSGDGRCISLLKVLFSNECIYDCKYCMNRRSNDVPRTSFTSEELAELTISFYRRNYIEGLFLSSGITRSPNDTMEQMYKTIYMLRTRYNFHGYIHVKAIPGADPSLIDLVGWYADRMSVNLELPTTDSLEKLAPNKSRKKILTPMKHIQLQRDYDREFHGELLPYTDNFSVNDNSVSDNSVNYTETNGRSLTSTAHHSVIRNSSNSLAPNGGQANSNTTAPNGMQGNPNSPAPNGMQGNIAGDFVSYPDVRRNFSKPPVMTVGTRRYVPAGQSTQMIIGATPDTDYEIIHVSEALYNKFDLKRVFYSAFVNVTHDPILPEYKDGPPLLREHRLYQADWLLRFYQFTADEIITKDHPTLNILLDPKCNYALNHLEMFPVEVTTASYHTLLRVPGIGVTSARRIMAARNNSHQYCKLTFADLKRLGIVLKRAQYFITCCGKSMIPLKLSQSFILANLLCTREKLPSSITQDEAYEQLSIFDFTSQVEQTIAGFGHR
ncbi:MAG: putative DNA modification/repair radical SAM protein [Lachnospiraceae bacterium]|nr:putative DNA modification/repair radical SAM protein [Lachnospiraceae bacterium]